MPNDVDALISDLLASPVTGDQLRQDARHSAGLSTTDAERVRAHLLASFEQRGVPDDTRAVLAEELRTSASPTVLAGAARAVRGIDPADGDDSGDWAALLRDAADRIETADVYVRWHPGVVAPGWLRTARDELLETLRGIGASATGPSSPASPPAEPPTLALDGAALDAVRLEDQDGLAMTLAEALDGRETVLAFFYTRCMNPAKCSLTITRLAAAARHDEHRAYLAMTYDPAYDSPARLRRYGADRGVPFGDHARFVRTVDAWADVRRMFDLRVGYGPVTVNEHARELFLVGPDLVARGLEPDSLTTPAQT